MEANVNPSRLLTIVGLAGIGLIHLLDSVDTYSETRWLFWAYVALMAGTSRRRRAAASPGCPLVRGRRAARGNADRRLHLQPHDRPPWRRRRHRRLTEPLGLASLWVEGAVAARPPATPSLPRAVPGAGPTRSTIGPLET